MFSTPPPSPIPGTMLEDKGYWPLNIVFEEGRRGVHALIGKHCISDISVEKGFVMWWSNGKKWLAQRLRCMKDPRSRVAFMTFVTVVFFVYFPWKHRKTANFHSRIKCYRLDFSLKPLISEIKGIWKDFFKETTTVTTVTKIHWKEQGVLLLIYNVFCVTVEFLQ